MQDPRSSAVPGAGGGRRRPMTPEQFAAYVRGEYARYGKLMPELGIKP